MNKTEIDAFIAGVYVGMLVSLAIVLMSGCVRVEACQTTIGILAPEPVKAGSVTKCTAQRWP